MYNIFIVDVVHRYHQMLVTLKLFRFEELTEGRNDVCDIRPFQGFRSPHRDQAAHESESGIHVGKQDDGAKVQPCYQKPLPAYSSYPPM